MGGTPAQAVAECLMVKEDVLGRESQRAWGCLAISDPRTSVTHLKVLNFGDRRAR
ncbi:MAG: hypothetical protein ACI8PQ_000904 [Planctomycetota bacterium]|jgi:hypothetical protein